MFSFDSQRFVIEYHLSTFQIFNFPEPKLTPTPLLKLLEWFSSFQPNKQSFPLLLRVKVVKNLVRTINKSCT